MQFLVSRSFLLTAVAAGSLAAQAPAAPPVPPVPAMGSARIVQVSPGGSYLGIGVQDVDGSRARELKLSEERGVEVTAVEEDSPASRAGLRKGDVVLEMNGQRVEGVEQFVRMVRETPVGRDVRLSVSRTGAAMMVTAKVAQRKSWSLSGDRSFSLPAIPLPPPARGMDMPRPTMSWRNGALGVEAEGLKGGLAEFFGVKQGVLIRSVSKGSPAEKAGLKAGDVIVRVNDKGVEAPGDVAAIVRERGDRKTLNLVIVREKREQPMSVTLEDDEHGAVTPRAPSIRTVRNVGNEWFF
ncbi:MAG: PDZ domain-containing protein [Bryobacteraceae bacterium]|nr:PDZ domain-containing protein [Bryobacteraceae bacterium]